MRQPANKQHGAAVIVALFVVVLSALAVSPLIWNLFASAKTIAVDASRDQAELVAHSGLDWARVILREDSRVSTTDTLAEPWAVPLAESRISEGLMRRTEKAEDREAVLTGTIEDAQGRFNLRNLGLDNSARKSWVEAFEKLAELLNIAPEQTELVEQVIERMFMPAQTPNNKDEASEKTSRLIAAQQWDELHERYDIAEETWQQLRPYVVLLPTPSTVNANTASAEVLYAVIEKLSFSQAQSLVAQRDRASFRNLADVQNIVGSTVPVNNNLITISSRFFLVEGTSQVDAALIRTRALLERRDQHVYVIWRQ